MSTRNLTRNIARGLTRSIVGAAAGSASSGSATPEGAPALASPRFPLFVALNWAANSIAAAGQSFSDNDKTYLANTIEGFWQNNTTPSNTRPAKSELDFMRALNSGMVFLSYKNSTFNGNKVADANAVEGNRLNCIQMYKEGTLRTAILDLVTTTVVIDLASTQGIKASTLAGVLSSDLSSYVTFIRIGNELMRIESIVSLVGSVLTITVTRGLDSSTKATHAASDPVLAPLYCQNNNPGGSGTVALRYALRVENSAIEALAFMGPEMAQYVDATRDRDGIMLDLLAPFSPQQRDAFNVARTPWNFDTGANMTAVESTDHKEAQIKIIQDDLTTRHGSPVDLYGNNLNDDYETVDGGTERFFRSTVLKPTPIDAMFFEFLVAKPTGGGYEPFATWEQNLSDFADCAQRNRKVIGTSKPIADFSTEAPLRNADYIARELADYVGLGLTWDGQATEPMAGFSLLCAGSTGPGAHIFNVGDCWYLDIGDPVGPSCVPFNMDEVQSLDYDGSTVHTYLREWTRACFIQNPTSSNDSAVTNLPASRFWFDFDTGTTVTTVQLAANGSKVVFAYDALVEFNASATTRVGSFDAKFGNGPYTYSKTSSASVPFAVAADGTVTVSGALTNHIRHRYILTADATDALGVVLSQEFLIMVASDIDASVTSSTPVSFDLLDDKAVDLKITGGAAYVQFGDDTLTTGTWAANKSARCKTRAFGDELIAPPPGSSKMVVRGVTGTVTVAANMMSRRLVPRPRGAKYELKAANSTTAGGYFLNMGTALSLGAGAGQDTTMVALVRRSANHAATATIMGLYPSNDAAGTGGVLPTLRMGITAGGVLSGNITDNGNTGTTTATVDATGLVAGEINLVWMVYTVADKKVRCGRYAPSFGARETTSAAGHANGLNIDPLRTVIILSNGNDAQVWQDSGILGLAVFGQALDLQVILQMYGPNAPPWPLIPADQTKCHVYCPVDASDPTLDTISGRRFAITPTNTDNWTQVAASDLHATHAFNVENCWRAMTTASVAAPAYTGSASADLDLLDNPLGSNRYSLDDTLTTDVGSAPDTSGGTAQSLAISDTATFYCGDSEKFEIKSAGASGNLYLNGRDYFQISDDMEWENLTGSLTGLNQIWIDFEFLRSGFQYQYDANDPNVANYPRLCYLDSSVGGGVSSSVITDLNPYTMGLLTPSLKGRDYITSTGWGTILEAVKAAHFCCSSVAPKWFMGGVKVVAGITQAVLSTPTLDGSNNPTAWTDDQIGDVQSLVTGSIGLKNPLFSQNPSQNFVSVCGVIADAPGGGDTSTIGWAKSGEEVWRSITSPGSDADASFRHITGTPYIITMKLEVSGRGKMQLTDTSTAPYTTVDLATEDDGTQSHFDPQGIIDPSGRMWMLAQTHTRTVLSIYRQVTDNPLDGFEIYNELPIPAGASAAGGGNFPFRQSPEPWWFANRIWCASTIKYGPLITTPVLNAAKTEVWMEDCFSFSRWARRVDRGARDGSTGTHHETEIAVTRPHPVTGLRQLCVIVNSRPDGSSAGTVTSQAVVCRTGIRSRY